MYKWPEVSWLMEPKHESRTGEGEREKKKRENKPSHAKDQLPEQRAGQQRKKRELLRAPFTANTFREWEWMKERSTSSISLAKCNKREMLRAHLFVHEWRVSWLCNSNIIMPAYFSHFVTQKTTSTAIIRLDALLLLIDTLPFVRTFRQIQNTRQNIVARVRLPQRSANIDSSEQCLSAICFHLVEERKWCREENDMVSAELRLALWANEKVLANAIQLEELHSSAKTSGVHCILDFSWLRMSIVACSLLSYQQRWQHEQQPLRIDVMNRGDFVFRSTRNNGVRCRFFSSSSFRSLAFVSCSSFIIISFGCPVVLSRPDYFQCIRIGSVTLALAHHGRSSSDTCVRWSEALLNGGNSERGNNTRVITGECVSSIANWWKNQTQLTWIMKVTRSK